MSRKPLRILFCTQGYPPGPGGGAEHQAKIQAEELVRRGHSVTVCCPSAAGLGSTRINGVEVVRLRWLHRWWFMQHFTYLPRLALFLALRVRRYDVVHVHIASLQADVAVLIARLLRRPVYVKVAGGGRGRETARLKPIARLTRYVGLRGASRVQAISEAITADLLAVGVLPDNIVKIPNGLATQRWHRANAEERADARCALNLPPDCVVVLFAGRFAREKGLRDLLEVWEATSQLHSAKLVLVGTPAPDDPLGPINESESVIVHGWTEALEQYYWASDILVLPSYAEGMSNTLLEAMACGLAVLATRVGAAPNMIRNGEDGFLIDPRDRAGLSMIMTQLISDRQVRERVGAMAAANVRERFAIERIVSEIELSYRAITSNMDAEPEAE